MRPLLLLAALVFAAPGALAAEVPEALQRVGIDLEEIKLADRTFDRTSAVLEEALAAVRAHPERAGGDALRDAFVRQQAAFDAFMKGRLQTALALSMSARLDARKAAEAAGRSTLRPSVDRDALKRARETDSAQFILRAQQKVPEARIVVERGLVLLELPES